MIPTHLEPLNITDPYLPQYHFVAGNRMNDPQPFYWEEKYHVFFNHHKHTVIRKACRGHATSEDLVHWKLEKMAFEPTENGPDANGCWTGSFVRIANKFYTFYTGCVSRENPLIQTQNMATSFDLIHWDKHPTALNITKPKNINAGECWRDPLVWQENDDFFMLLGSENEVDNTPMALLYSSKNLIDWEFDRIFSKDVDTRLGNRMECPDFFALKDKHLLLSCEDIAPFMDMFYRIGRYENSTFITEKSGNIDLGMLYAAKTLVDDKNRRILFGWVFPTRSNEDLEKAKWSGALSLPRELSLNEDKTLIIKPVEELKALRKEEILVSSNSLHGINELKGDCLEVIMEVEISDDGIFEIMPYYSTKNQNNFTVLIDKKHGTINKKPYHFSKETTLHLFIDRSIVEFFFDYQVSYTDNYYDYDLENTCLNINVIEGNLQIKKIEAWKLGVL
jgi:beta-fructofuranosidase